MIPTLLWQHWIFTCMARVSCTSSIWYCCMRIPSLSNDSWLVEWEHPDYDHELNVKHFLVQAFRVRCSSSSFQQVTGVFYGLPRMCPTIEWFESGRPLLRWIALNIEMHRVWEIITALNIKMHWVWEIITALDVKIESRLTKLSFCRSDLDTMWSCVNSSLITARVVQSLIPFFRQVSL